MGDCTSLVEETVPSLVVVCRLAQPQIQQIGRGHSGRNAAEQGEAGGTPIPLRSFQGLSKALPRYNNPTLHADSKP